MTRDKAHKGAIRARMDKTGEHYTTARHYLLDLHRNEQPKSDASLPEAVPSPLVAAAAEPPAMTPEPALPPRVAEPGVSDAAVRKATSKGWDEWFALLDAWNGTTHSHPELARHLSETYGIDGWWAQGVTVGYERARGMRALHQRPNGFSASVSKTFPVPVERLFAAFVEQGKRERWLEAVELRNRTSQPHKSARFDVLPGETRLAVTFIARGAEKSVAQLEHERLADAEDVARWKALWKDQLAFLAAILAEETAKR